MNRRRFPQPQLDEFNADRSQDYGRIRRHGCGFDGNISAPLPPGTTRQANAADFMSKCDDYRQVISCSPQWKGQRTLTMQPKTLLTHFPFIG